MANLIDVSYFFGDIKYAQKSESGVNDKLNNFINTYEPELLEALLGYELYKALQTENTQRITDIKTGVEYIGYDTLPKKWKGLTYTVEGTKKSLIAYYVFYKITISDLTTSTGAGQKKIKTENSEEVSPKIKLFNAWNSMVELNLQLTEFLERNYLVYPEFQRYNGVTKEQENILSRANYVF